jgi:hypothetical protein
MNNKIKNTLIAVTLSLSVLGGNAQITWPQGQLLPTFPASARTQDHIYLNNNTDAEMFLFSSLKGLINRTQPRIFSYEGDNAAEGAFTWLNSVNVGYTETTPWTVLGKYKSEISGLIVYDPDQIHTVNLAARLAKDYNALVASPELLPRLAGFPVLLDLRGQFTSKLEVYQYVFDNYWQNTDKRLLIGLSPDFHKGSLREYAIALGAAVVWLDPEVSAESTLLNKFLASMPAGANYMGWWPEEQPGVERVSHYGFTTIASDYSTNLAFHSGLPRRIEPRPMPAKPALQNKIYVAFILSDGDNLQYVEHLMRKLWNNSDRGKVPIGWTVSPAMVDAMPGALNYYHQSATDNDNLISGPSGYGYTYPNYWLQSASHVTTATLADFVAKTEEYNVAAGLRVVTIWNTINGGIDGNVGNIFAANTSTLLGVTAQNTQSIGSPIIYSTKLPGKRLSCNYCTDEQAMKNHIAAGALLWNGAAPRFLIIQAQPWNGVTPTTFKNVANSLGDDYVVVRPDHIFQLIRESVNLPVNPGAVTGTGEGLTGTYYNGKNFDTKITERIDDAINFDWGEGSPVAGLDADNFTVRWRGQIQPPFSGHYAFNVTCDGVKLWINNKLIIDKLSGGRNPNTYIGKIDSLKAGEKYDITLEYLEQTGVAKCKMEWESAFLPREVVPQSQLYKDASVSDLYANVAPNLKVVAENGLLNVEIPGYNNEEVTVSLHNLYGKTLLHQRLRSAKTQIDISSLERGVYLVSIQANNYSKTIKFLQP